MALALCLGLTVPVSAKLSDNYEIFSVICDESQPEKVDGKRHQRVDIYYSTIGLWTAPEPETLEREYLAYYQAMRKRKKKTA